MATQNSTRSPQCNLFRVLEKLSDQDFFPKTAETMNQSQVAKDVLGIELSTILSASRDERMAFFVDFAARCIEAGRA